MQIDRSPFLKLDPATVRGYLKAGESKDPDVLHGRKAQLVSLGAFPKHVGLYLMVMGALLTVLILTAFMGIPLLIFGWWMRRRGVENLSVVETTFAEYLVASEPTGAEGAKPRIVADREIVRRDVG